MRLRVPTLRYLITGHASVNKATGKCESAQVMYLSLRVRLPYLYLTLSYATLSYATLSYARAEGRLPRESKPVSAARLTGPARPQLSCLISESKSGVFIPYTSTHMFDRYRTYMSTTPQLSLSRNAARPFRPKSRRRHD